MDKTSLLILCVFLFQFGCKGQNNDRFEDIGYIKSKEKFDEKFTSHFPKKLDSDSSTIVSKRAPEINKVGITLYEYEVDKTKIDSIMGGLLNKHIAVYEYSDTCLLVVNRFETIDPFDYEAILDSSLLYMPCYDKKYPVPNFIEYPEANLHSGFKLDNSFVIYVLEAKPGNHFPRYKMNVFKQMPNKWKNGYSKGVAISKAKKTVIYWSVMW